MDLPPRVADVWIAAVIIGCLLAAVIFPAGVGIGYLIGIWRSKANHG